MKEPKKSVIRFDNIQNRLTDEDEKQLKVMYVYYHRLMTLYKWSYRSVKRKRVALDFGSLSLAAIGVVVGSATLNVLVLAVISGTGLILNGTAKLLDLKEKESAYLNAYKIYTDLLIRILSYLRGIPYVVEVLVSDMALLDELISRDTPYIKRKHKVRYDKTHSDEGTT